MKVARVLFAVALLVSPLAGCLGGKETGGDSAPPLDPNAATVYFNGLVWTGDPDQPEAEALLVENGTLVFVGPSIDALALRPDAPRFDLGGRRVIPGMIDSHTHFVRVAAAWNCDAVNNPFLPSYDNSQLSNTEFEISRAQIASYHQQTNASGKTPVDDRTAIADKEVAKRGLACAMKEASAMGLTMTIEAGTSSWDYWDVLKALEKEGRVSVRQSLYLVPPLLDEAVARGIRTGYGSDVVRIAGIKFYSDGWLGPRTAALLAPYNDRPGSRGVLFLEQQEADAWVQRAHDAGLKAATHTIGDQGVAVMLNAYTKALANDANASDARYSFEHASTMQMRFIEGMAAIGGIASYQHSFATSDQRFMDSAVGAERAKLVYPWKTMMDAGIVLAGGSDFPIEVLPPLWGLQRVVTRQELDGTPSGGWHPEQRLSVEEALRTITWNAAYDVFMEDRLGSLEVGKLADFVVLDRDILTIPSDQIAKTCVVKTYVGGRLVYDGTGTTSRCAQMSYQGVLAPRDDNTADALEAQLEREAFHGTRLS